MKSSSYTALLPAPVARVVGSMTVWHAAAAALAVSGWAVALSRSDPARARQSTLPFYGLNLDKYWNDAACSRVVRYGKTGSGGWEVCADARFPLTSESTVLSFGVDADDTFGRDVRSASGATVHAFDPSDAAKSAADGVQFHRWGLGGEDVQGDVPRWTLGTVRKELHLPGDAAIDIVKVDVDHGEWDALRHACFNTDLSRVRQLAVRFHLRPPSSDAIDAYIDERRAVIDCLGTVGFRFFRFRQVDCGGTITGETGVTLSRCFTASAMNMNLLRRYKNPAAQAA